MIDNIPEGLCQCGCGHKTRISEYDLPQRGYVKGEPRPYLKNHYWRGRQRTDLYATYRIVDTGHKTPCWLWPKVVADHGYVQITRDGRRQQAHRYYYEQRHGPVPASLHLDHLCRVKHCVNPEHLEPVTPAVNRRRGNGVKLTLEKAEEIRRLHASGQNTQQALADQFGVSVMTVNRIVRQLIWRSNHG